jgi:hypothetical protein
MTTALAAVLNLIWPGTGYYVVAQMNKATTLTVISIVYFVFSGLLRSLLLSLFMAAFGRGSGMFFFVAIIFCEYAYRIVAVIDVVMISRRVERGDEVAPWAFFNL